MQDATKRVYIFGQEDPGKDLLLCERPVLGTLVGFQKSLYLVEPEHELLQFYELQRIPFVDYLKQFSTFVELQPYKKLCIIFPCGAQ